MVIFSHRKRMSLRISPFFCLSKPNRVNMCENNQSPQTQKLIDSSISLFFSNLYLAPTLCYALLQTLEMCRRGRCDICPWESQSCPCALVIEAWREVPIQPGGQDREISYFDSFEEVHSQNIKCFKKKSYQAQKTKEADDRTGEEGRGWKGGSTGILRTVISTGLTIYYFGILNSYEILSASVFLF